MIKADSDVNTKLRHIDIRKHWLKKVYRDRKISVVWVNTKDMAADALTKAISIGKIQKARKLLCLH